METLFSFLIKASSGIVLFYLVYWFFLRKETFYSANRWFLITALITAVLLPIFPIQYNVFIEPDKDAVLKTITDTFKNIPVISGTEPASQNISSQQAILLIYLTGMSIFILRLLTQSFILIRVIFKFRIKSLDGVRIVENEKYGLPFSFFNVVFINPKFHTQENLPEILAHEKVHIRENHWFDLLFIELLTVIFWFNPFIWFFERSIKQNHEYLADKGVLAQGHRVAKYQALLINQLMGMQIIGVTNNLNFALGTNRLKMMTKTKTPKKKGFKFMVAIPALTLLLLAFAEPNYQSSQTSTVSTTNSTNELIIENTIKLVGTVVDENGEPLPGASVVIKNSTVGTVCNMDGKFELDVPENATIVISFVGKKTIENLIKSKSGSKEGEVNNKYKMEDAIILIDTELPPPPPPPAPKTEKLAPPPPPPPSKVNKEQEIFYIVEDMPQYPGGAGELAAFVNKKMKTFNLKGNAQIGFTVNGKGKVTDIKIVSQDNDKVGKAAAEIVGQMPDWTPGKQRGKSVPVKYLIPIEFK